MKVAYVAGPFRGTSASEGARTEVEEAHRRGIPVYYKDNTPLHEALEI